MIYQFKADKTNAGLNFDINLQKDKRVYCFIGENGVGKTQLLETMAKSVLYSHSLLKDNGKYLGRFYRKGGIFEGNWNTELKLYFAEGINLNGFDFKNLVEIRMLFGASSVEEYEAIHSAIQNINKPFIYIGAQNRGYAKNLDTNNIKILGDRSKRLESALLKTYNYMNSLPVDEVSFADWFMSRLMINRNFVAGQEKTDHEVILVCKLLQGLEPIRLKDLLIKKDDSYTINMAIADGELLFNGIPIDKLSTGYISIIKIFQDIIDGFSSWRLNENEKIEEMEGIVFIDEIESHLHPKWERAIIPFLKKHFPKATFYVATHSPLVISSTEEGEAYELVKEDEYIVAKELGNPRSWYMADIYSQAFHVDYNEEFEKEQENIIQLTAEFSKAVKEYTKTKNDSLKPEIEKIYQDLDKILAASDPRRMTIENLKKLVA